MSEPLRVVVADDERPARTFLTTLLRSCDGAALVGEAGTGREALATIERERPDLALLDLQMPDLGGLEVARQLSERADGAPPLVAFVTAFDEFAIEAFEVNAVDYLLKPVELDRLQATLDRARTRLDHRHPPEQQSPALAGAAAAYARAVRQPSFLERLPVRRQADVLLLPVRQIASVLAEGELLHVTTLGKERYTITHRLHLLEARLDPRRFVRLARGTLVNIDAIARISPMPGGTSVATLTNGQELQVSRIQSRVLRETLLKL